MYFSSVLATLIGLITLSMKNNNVRIIPANSFASSERLQDLNLANNKLDDCAGFAGAIGLRRLNVSGNRFSCICAEWRASPALVSLDLRHNRLGNLSVSRYPLTSHASIWHLIERVSSFGRSRT